MSAAPQKRSLSTAPGDERDPKRHHRRSPTISLAEKTAAAPFNSPNAEFVIRTKPNDTHFLVSLAVLSIASPYFDKIRSEQTPPERGQLEAPESDAIIETILRFTYPNVPDPILHDLDDVREAFEAARKYQLRGVENKLREMMVSARFLDSEPVRVYAIARRYNLDDVACVAALSALKQPPRWPDYEEFEHISARAYHRLIQFHRTRSNQAVNILENLFSDGRCDPAKVACEACGKWPPTWWSYFVKKAKCIIKDTPVSDSICTADFILATCAKIERGKQCWSCLIRAHEAVQPGGIVQLLKKQIDALPVDILDDDA
ncbi:hypothetical protein K474DRAFT_234953 [Panus rudis PR-1116 ss-1]|nr:hypothetical protein K474DRAFT_234953 [Panus rudis PR-1116 ss-1]